MESIRAAGGAEKAKLKSAKDRKLAKKQKQEKAASPKGGGDLMGDLFSKLAMRRKGISGTKGQGGSVTESSNQGGENKGSPMDKLSSIIPTVAATGHGDDEDDWD